MQLSKFDQLILSKYKTKKASNRRPSSITKHFRTVPNTTPQSPDPPKGPEEVAPNALDVVPNEENKVAPKENPVP